MRRLAALTIGAALALAGHAAGAPDARAWKIDRDASTIAFDYTLGGESRSGAFERFSGDGAFDPVAPALATLTLTIETGSIQLGDPLLNAGAVSPFWFDSATYPEASFVLQRLTPRADGRWDAHGALTLRGVTRDATGELSLDIGAEIAHAVGAVTLERTPFGVGDGVTDLVVDVGETVAVRFDIIAHPAP